ncbi:MAG TPA: TerC family protein [Myxococcales bacterium]|jgi:tellurite resistance protein TerC
MASAGSPVLWIVFGVLVVVSLAIDLGVHKKDDHAMAPKAALFWALVWIGTAVAFGFGVSPFVGSTATLDYFTAYLLEKALSVDNLFVFIVLFGFFKIPPVLQRRVLFWGIVGALLMRAIFIFLGVALLSKFHFLFYVFGAFLIYTGGKLLFAKGEEVEPQKNFAYRLFTRFFRISENIEHGHFFVVENGRRVATRLMLVLVVIEATDVLFAVDSIPAVLAVTTDPFVVYTSNIFAILGLRALYFLLATWMARFRYLNVGLSFVLAFIGVKMISATAGWFKIPPALSLGVVGGMLTVAITASLLADRQEKKENAGNPPELPAHPPAETPPEAKPPAETK